MLASPLPYVANTTGWMTAELAAQPWLIYGLMRTSEGASPHVSRQRDRWWRAAFPRTGGCSSYSRQDSSQFPGAER